MTALHPLLQSYFAAIPAGSVGIGEGVFERFGTEVALQNVSLTVDAPVLGRVYEYHGSFTYRIEEET